MIVQRGDLEVVLLKRGKHGIDFRVGQHEVAVRGGAVDPERLERRPAAEGKARLHLHGADGDVEIGPRKRHAVDVARHRRAGLADRFVDGCGVEARRLRCRRLCGERGEKNDRGDHASHDLHVKGKSEKLEVKRKVRSRKLNFNCSAFNFHL